MEHKLLEAINTAQMFAGKRPTMPILASVCVNGTVKSTDLEMFYQAGGADLDCTELGNGGYSLAQVKAMYKSAAKCKPLFNLEEYPTFPTMGTSDNVEVDADDLAQRLNRLISFASKDETRYNITSVCIGKESVIATNGHCLLEIETPTYKELIPEKSDKFYPNGKILLPVDAAKKIVKWIKNRRIEKVTISCDSRLLSLVSSDSGVLETITCRLVDGQFPNTTDITSMDEYVGKVYCQVPELLNAVKTVCSVLPLVQLQGSSHAGKGKLVMLSQEKITGTEGYRLTISGSDKDNGIKTSKSIDCSVTYFKPGEIVSINGLYLMDYLNGIKGRDETVTLKYKDAYSMIRVERTSNCMGECLIIMPVVDPKKK